MRELIEQKIIECQQGIVKALVQEELEVAAKYHKLMLELQEQLDKQIQLEKK